MPRNITKNTAVFTRFFFLSMVLSLFGCSASAKERPSGGLDMENEITQTYPGGKWTPGAAQYGVEKISDVRLRMDDGTELQASIAYPVDLHTGKRTAEKFPVVIEYTPYVRFSRPIEPIAYFAEHGYISVVVWARGTGKSDGEFQMMSKRDRMDGKSIVEWAAHKLDGSDGRVALIGCSFPAGLALATTSEVGKGSPLKAMVCANNGFESALRQCWLVNGLPTLGFTSYTSGGRYLYGNTPAANRFFDNVVEGISSGGDIAHDGDYWADRSPMQFAERIVDNDIPVLLWSGYRDILDVLALKTYIALQNAYAGRPVFAPMENGQPVSPSYQLIMGNWEHAQALDLGIYLQWLETWVRGIDTGIGTTDTPLHLFEGGSDRWFNASRYPMTEAYTGFFLDATKNTLQNESAKEGTCRLVWGYPSQPNGKIVFETGAFDTPLTMAGPMALTLYASSSNRNMEIIANLYDVSPEGVATYVSRGVILGSQLEIDSAKSWTDVNGAMVWPWQTLNRDEYLSPNSVYKLHIALAPRAWQLQTGHHLRLELTTQSPEEVCPPGGGSVANSDEPGYLNNPQRQTIPGGIYTIYCGKEYPSCLYMPVLEQEHTRYVPSSILRDSWMEGARKLGKGNAYPLPLEW